MTMEVQKKSLFRVHPIQLDFINIVELSIRVETPYTDRDELPDEEVKISHGHTKYDPESKTIQAGLILEVGLDDAKKSDPGFSIRIELFGNFTVDESRFDVRYVEDWAKRNSQFILMPDMREQVYNLTSRCELPPLILPLLEVPSFEVKKPKKKVAQTEAIRAAKD